MTNEKMSNENLQGAKATLGFAIILSPLVALILSISVGFFFGIAWGFLAFGCFLALVVLWMILVSVSFVKSTTTEKENTNTL